MVGPYTLLDVEAILKTSSPAWNPGTWFQKKQKRSLQIFVYVFSNLSGDYVKD